MTSASYEQRSPMCETWAGSFRTAGSAPISSDAGGGGPLAGGSRSAPGRAGLHSAA